MLSLQEKEHMRRDKQSLTKGLLISGSHSHFGIGQFTTTCTQEERAEAAKDIEKLDLHGVPVLRPRRSFIHPQALDRSEREMEGQREGRPRCARGKEACRPLLEALLSPIILTQQKRVCAIPEFRMPATK